MKRLAARIESLPIMQKLSPVGVLGLMTLAALIVLIATGCGSPPAKSWTFTTTQTPEEVRSWAKQHDLKVTKEGDGYRATQR